MLRKSMVQRYTTLNRIDTDRRTAENGVQFCKNDDKHPYEQRNQIQHRNQHYQDHKGLIEKLEVLNITE